MGSQGREQQSQFQTLARQSSIYSLTLEEVQNQLGDLGKPLGSMNLDELLKNVWSAEANQGIGMDNEADSGYEDQYALGSGLQRQGSVTLTQTLTKKTVDEVWREIQERKSRNEKERRAQERQVTFGEMTLEDFLMKAGVVTKELEKNLIADGDSRNMEGLCNLSSFSSIDPMPATKVYPQWMQFHQRKNMMNAYAPGHPLAQPLGISASPLLDVGYSESQMAMPSPLMGSFSDTQAPGRKRVASEDVMEKSIERRQKRMIKNRESAARSRARKQAYTNGLENKVSRLQEENERLKKQNELDRMLHCTPIPEPKYQLRRTSSAPL